PNPPVQHLATVLREDDDVILTVPLGVGLALPIFHGGPPAPRGLPQGGPSQIHVGNGRACRSLTARGGGFLLIEHRQQRLGTESACPSHRTKKLYVCRE